MPAAVAFAPSGKQVACVYLGGQVDLVDLATRRRRGVQGAWGAASTTDASALATARLTRTARHYSIAFSPDGKGVLAADGLGGIVRIDVAAGRVVARSHPEYRLGGGQIPPAGAAAFTAVDPTGRRVAWPTANGTVLIYDAKSIKPPTKATTRPGGSTGRAP